MLLKILLFGVFLILLLVAIRVLNKRGKAGTRPPLAPTKQMSLSQAQAILGLEDANPLDKDAVIAAHRHLMQHIHPDKGGSAALAQQLNEAKHVLLGKL